MTDFPVGPALKIIEGGFKSVRFVYRRAKQRKETDRLVFQALVVAACPANADPSRSEGLATAIAKRLAKTDFPKEAHPQRREQVLPPALRQVLRGADDVEGDPFAARLESWVATAARADDVATLLDGFRCDGYRVDAEAIATRFRACFHILLLDNPSKFRTALAKEIHAADSFREWGTKVRRDSAAAISATAVAGVGVSVAAEALNLSDPAAIGGSAALLVGVAGAGVVARMLWRRPDPLRETAHRLTLAWITDLLHLEIGEREGDVNALRAGIAGLSADGQGQVSDEMLSDLTRRLVPAAREAGDDALAAALLEIEDAEVRSRRGVPSSLRVALLGALDAVSDDPGDSGGGGA